MDAGRALVAACLTAAAIAAPGGCRRETAPPAPVVPSQAGLVEPRPWPAKEADTRAVECLELAGQDGAGWKLCQVSAGDRHAVVSSRREGGEWSPRMEIALLTAPPTPGHAAAALDADGWPVYVWTDAAETPGEQAFFATHRTGDGWTRPLVLDRTASRDFVFPAACTGPDGTVHVIYTRRLDPPEEYATGLFPTEGQFPQKLFHVFFDGDRWSRPKPTTGRGRFDVGRPQIGLDADGKVRVVAEITTYPRVGDRQHFPGTQAWDGKTWSEFERFRP